MAIARSLRSTGITPLQHYKETALSAGTPLGGQVFGQQWFIALDADDAVKVSAFHSLWVGKAGGELIEQSAPLRRISTFGLAVGAACAFSLGIAGQVLKFRTRARTRVMPPIHRAPRGQ